MIDTTLLVALGGGAGITLLLRESVSVVASLRNGISAREGKRRVDIVQQRDEAILRADREEQRADDEANKRRTLLEYVSKLRRRLIENGIEPDEPPDLGTTIRKPINPPKE